MRKSVDAIPSHGFGAWFAPALMVVFGVIVCHAQTNYNCPMSATTTIPAPSWGGNEAYQGILNWNNYFYSGQNSTQNSNLYLYNGEANYDQPNGNGFNFGVVFDWSTDNGSYQTDFSGKSGGSPSNNPYWGTFYVEGEALETAVDAYWWAKANGGDKAKYLAEVNNIAQGIIDEMWPVSNFYSNHAPWQSGYSGDALKWYGAGYTDTNYASSERNHDGGGGDWFNDDLMWLAIAFEGAFDVTKDAGTPVLGWRYVTQNMVDYVYANAQGEVSADGSEVGLLQAFCNANNGKNAGCVYDSVHHLYTGSSWFPNMGGAPNFSFVIAARMLADDLSETFPNGTYNTEAQKVWKWAMNNLIDSGSQSAGSCSTYMGTKASTFGSLSTTQTCAEVFTSNNSEIMNKGGNPVGYNGEGGYWSGINSTTYNVWPSGTFDLVMNYGIAIKAAILMGYDHGNPDGNPDIAQEVTNYLMYGIVNTNWPYSGTVTYGTSGISYNILPYYNSSADSSNNNPGQASIAIRDVAFGLSSNVGPNSSAVLDGLAKNWAQVNVQAAWNNRNDNNVMWSNWCQQSSTSKTPISNSSPTPTFYSWDDSAAVAGILTVPGTY